jgi:hypothetical protein
MESRRAFLRMAGVSVLVVGCGAGDERDPPAPATTTDADVLNAALDLEHAAVAAYGAAVPVLYGELGDTGRRFLEQEREHARALAHAIRRLGVTPNRPRASYDFLPLADATAALRLAHDLEGTTVAAYLDALRKLRDPRLRHTAGTIVAAEAEQLAVLRQALGHEAVPHAFERGEGG